MLAAVLKAVIAQRLIRKVCTKCNNTGCLYCSHTGYLGRTAIAEFIPVDTRLQDMIADETSIEQFRLYLQSVHFKTLYDDAEDKISSCLTTEQEILSELGVRQ